MKAIQRFAALHPLVFIILAALAWIVTGLAAAYLVAGALQASLADGLPQSLGTLAATVCLLLVMWRWGWLRAAGVTVLGSGRLWLLAAGLAVYVIVAYQLAFFGEITVDLSTLWDAGEAQAILSRQAVVGVVEETLFRGFLLYALVRVWGHTRRGLLAAVAAPAVIFGLSHIMQLLIGNPLEHSLMTMINAFFVGLWYGALVLLGGSLWPAVLVHAATNASVQLAAAGLPNFDPSVADLAVATAAEVPLVIAGLWLLLRNAPGSILAGDRERGAEAFTPASSIARLLLLLSLAGTLSLASPVGEATPMPAQPSTPAAAIATGPPAAERAADPHGCTVFTISKGNRVFFGGNDDYINPDSYYWVDPGGATDYGAIWIGMPDNVQQGVNERGLAYDANGLPRVDTNPHQERERVLGDYTYYPIQILHECATVEEVIEWVMAHQWHSYMHDQMQFADATGDAVIISAGADGELVLTRKTQGDGYLVSTNFNVANPANGYGYPCPRYKTAQKLLVRLVNQGDELTAQDATGVLDAVHVEGAASWTIESLVADLPNGFVYLYYFHQFDRPVVLNVAEEIARDRPGGPLSNLFPEEVRQEASRRYQQIQSQTSGCEMLGKVWLGLVVASLAALLISSARQRRGWIFWIPVVVILGPPGLLTWLAAGRRPGAGNWQTVLVEATGDVTPTIVAHIAVMVGLVLVPGALGSDLLQLLLFFGLPLLGGWLLFQGPLLTFATRKGYLYTLIRRLPHTWVAANLGMAAIFPIATPLADKSVQIPLSPWTVAAWWAFTAMSALAAMLLLLLYEGWNVRRGYRAWHVLARGEGDVVLAPFRKLWWWIPLSYAVLIAGVAGYLFLQQAMLR
jgi:membrane protease YdiL (CAAX protease family)